MNACNAALKGDLGCHTAYMIGQGGALTETEPLMDTSNTSPKANADAQKALELLAEAWAYFTPDAAVKLDDEEPDLFQYHAAA